MGRESGPRLTREQWLEQAMAILGVQGVSGLSLNNLINKFDVTKGSFYWHFENQADFHAALVDYWHQKHTLEVGNRIDALDLGPKEKFEEVLKTIVAERHDVYDAVIVALAAQEPELRSAVQASFEYRAGLVRRYLSGMGFRGKDLKTRIRMTVAFTSAERAVNAKRSMKERLAQVKENVEFLTR